MGKYFLTSIQTIGDSSPVSTFAYNTLKEALSAYHATLASDYIASLDGFACVVLNEHGGTEAKEYWEKTPVPNPPAEEVPAEETEAVPAEETEEISTEE